MTSENYLSLSECKHSYLYSILARNFSLGIYNSQYQSFLGIRQKFNQEYLFFEIHWDFSPQFGTAKPLREIERCPFEIINWQENEQLFKWLKQKETELNC